MIHISTYNTILFYNFTDTNFTFTYDKETYTVKAGQRESFPEFLALHGAKHLVDRELIRSGKVKQLNDVTERNKTYEVIMGKKAKEPTEDTVKVEEEFPEKLQPKTTEVKETNGVDLSRKELFAKVKSLGIKIHLPKSNDELRQLIAQA